MGFSRAKKTVPEKESVDFNFMGEIKSENEHEDSSDLDIG